MLHSRNHHCCVTPRVLCILSKEFFFVTSGGHNWPSSSNLAHITVRVEILVYVPENSSQKKTVRFFCLFF